MAPSAFLRLQAMFLLVGCCLVLLASGFNLGRESSPVFGLESLVRRVDPNIEYEFCDRSCAPRVSVLGDDGVAERSYVVSEDWVYNATELAERQMKLPEAGGMEAFMLNEVPKAQSIVWQIEKDTDMNTAILKEYGRNAFSFGTMGLCGCTSVWIISRKGVYASHWWESISFSPDNIWRRVKSETNTQVFKRTVLDPLHNGETSPKGRPMQAKLDAAALEDDFIRAYIVHPEKSCGPRSAVDGYRNRWEAIKTEVGGIIPSLDPVAHSDRWFEPIYERKDRDDPALFTSSAGRVLFKFDPKHDGKKRQRSG